MWVCYCRKFNEKAVKDAVEKNPDLTRVRDVYAVCSGGEEPICGTCLPTIKTHIPLLRTGKKDSEPKAERS